MRIMVSTFFLGLLLATLLAQFLMYVFFVPSANEFWRPSAFWDLLLLGMSRVFATVVVLVMILAFKDIVTDIIKETLFSFPTKAKWLRPVLAPCHDVFRWTRHRQFLGDVCPGDHSFQHGQCIQH